VTKQGVKLLPSLARKPKGEKGVTKGGESFSRRGGRKWREYMIEDDEEEGRTRKKLKF
jgi:hypothetical protein